MATQADFENNDLWLIYDATSGGGGGGAVWGSITGTLSAQTDLQTALNGKLNTTAVINDLANVNAPTPSNGETLIYNSTSGNWENGAASGGITIGDTVSGLSIANTLLYVDNSFGLANNNRLVYNPTIGFYHTGVLSTSINNAVFGYGAGNAGTAIACFGTNAGNAANNAPNIAIGQNAMRFGSGTSEGVNIGNDAGRSASGIRAVFSGYRSGNGNSGAYCVAIGDYTLYNGSGDSNVALGSNAMNTATTSQSVACGARSLLFGTGNANTALGYQSGQNNTGSNVLLLGYNAGNSNTQSNRVIIGQTNLPQFAGAAAAAAALPAASANGVYLYWDTTDNTIKARP